MWPQKYSHNIKPIKKNSPKEKSGQELHQQKNRAKKSIIKKNPGKKS